MAADAAFGVLAAVAVVAGALVFRVDSMARATYALLASLLAVGGVVLLLGLDYLGVVIVLMMTVEMALMGVFMVMFMMNPAGLMPMSMFHNTRGAAVLASAVFAGLASAVLASPVPRPRGHPPADPTRRLGEALMGTQMLTMMVLGMALFAAIVGAVVLAVRRWPEPPGRGAADPGGGRAR